MTEETQPTFWAAPELAAPPSSGKPWAGAGTADNKTLPPLHPGWRGRKDDLV